MNTIFGGEEVALLLMYGHVAFVHNFVLENFVVFELRRLSWLDVVLQSERSWV